MHPLLQSFQCTIVTPVFRGKNTLSRNRIVFKALKEELETIHAFTQASQLLSAIQILVPVQLTPQHDPRVADQLHSRAMAREARC